MMCLTNKAKAKLFAVVVAVRAVVVAAVAAATPRASAAPRRTPAPAAPKRLKGELSSLHPRTTAAQYSKPKAMSCYLYGKARKSQHSIINDIQTSALTLTDAA
jgi:hypothetical protein